MTKVEKFYLYFTLVSIMLFLRTENDANLIIGFIGVVLFGLIFVFYEGKKEK